MTSNSIWKTISRKVAQNSNPASVKIPKPRPKPDSGGSTVKK